jgi:N-methylhydantoinase A
VSVAPGNTASAPLAPRQAYFGEHGWLDTPVLARSDLHGVRAGPLIVEEYDSTCVVPPGARAEADAAGNIVITF